MKNTRLAFACALISLGGLALLAAQPVPAAAAPPVIIEPTVDGSVIDVFGGPGDGIPDFVRDEGLVGIDLFDEPPSEARGIVEFDISNLSHPIKRARLVLTVSVAGGPFPVEIEVFTYAGDGILSLDDFDDGTLHTSFKYSGGRKTVRLDVTSVVNNLLALGEEYVGFNFQFAIQTPTGIGPFIGFHSLEFPPAAYLRIQP